MSRAESWRVLPLRSASGPENMALDEALLTLVGEGLSPPTLRFYTWERPWVSLGSGQLAAEIDRAACVARGWGIVRRASGGTVVLHQGQVAYALILPSSHPLWAGDLAASYRRFAEPLRRAFARLGVPTTPAPPDASAEFIAHAPDLARRICFAALGPYELLREGRKLVGNSQIRRRLANTQHGVIQVVGHQEDLLAVLADTTASARAELTHYLHRKIGAVNDQAPGEVSLPDLTHAITLAFAEAFEVRIAEDDLSPTERLHASRLVADKYGADAWTFRR